MNPDDSFARLMSRLKEGDPSAANEVFMRYVRSLITLTSGQFDSWLRYKVDLEGVVQSAYKSFFVGHDQGRFDGLADWDGLWGCGRHHPAEVLPEARVSASGVPRSRVRRSPARTRRRRGGLVAGRRPRADSVGSGDPGGDG